MYNIDSSTNKTTHESATNTDAGLTTITKGSRKMATIDSTPDSGTPSKQPIQDLIGSIIFEDVLDADGFDWIDLQLRGKENVFIACDSYVAYLKSKHPKCHKRKADASFLRVANTYVYIGFVSIGLYALKSPEPHLSFGIWKGKP